MIDDMNVWVSISGFKHDTEFDTRDVLFPGSIFTDRNPIELNDANGNPFTRISSSME